jgi:hypothetical protein
MKIGLRKTIQRKMVKLWYNKYIKKQTQLLNKPIFNPILSKANISPKENPKLIEWLERFQ